MNEKVFVILICSLRLVFRVFDLFLFCGIFITLYILIHTVVNFGASGAFLNKIL